MYIVGIGVEGSDDVLVQMRLFYANSHDLYFNSLSSSAHWDAEDVTETAIWEPKNVKVFFLRFV